MRATFSEATRESVDVKKLKRSAFVVVIGKHRTPIFLPIRDAKGRAHAAFIKDAALVLHHEEYEGQSVKARRLPCRHIITPSVSPTRPFRSLLPRKPMAACNAPRASRLLQVPQHTRDMVGELCSMLAADKRRKKEAAARAEKAAKESKAAAKEAKEATPSEGGGGGKAKGLAVETLEAAISVTEGKFAGWTRKLSKSSGKYYIVSPDGQTKLWEAQARKQLDQGTGDGSPREYPAPRTLDYGSAHKPSKKRS